MELNYYRGDIVLLSDKILWMIHIRNTNSTMFIHLLINKIRTNCCLCKRTFVYYTLNTPLESKSYLPILTAYSTASFVIKHLTAPESNKEKKICSYPNHSNVTLHLQ